MAARTFYANFLTGDYIVNATSLAFLSEFDNGANPGNPLIVANGLLTEDNSPTFISSPFAISAMYAEIQAKLQTGITFVGAFNPHVFTGQHTFYFGNNTGTKGLTVATNRTSPSDVTVELLSSHTQLVLPGVGSDTFNQIAFQYDPVGANYYASINGSAVISAPANAEDFSAILIQYYAGGFSVGDPNGWIEYFGGYDASIDFSLLPQLSIYGVVPPDPFPGGGIADNQMKLPPLVPIPHNPGLWR